MATNTTSSVRALASAYHDTKANHAPA